MVQVYQKGGCQAPVCVCGGGGGQKRSDGKSTAPAWQQLCCSILVVRESDFGVEVVESSKRQVAVLDPVRQRSATATVSHSCIIRLHHMELVREQPSHTLASYACTIWSLCVSNRLTLLHHTLAPYGACA